MNKKLIKTILVILSLGLFLNTLSAAKTTYDVKCNDKPGEPFKVCWEGDREYLGQVTTESCTYEYTSEEVTEEFKTRAEAEAVCEKINSQKPACCTNKDPKYPMCAGQAVCKDTQKCKVECIKKYTVTFNATQGTFPDGSKIYKITVREGTVLIGSNIPRPKSPKISLSFKGWDVKFPYTVTENAVIKAKWGNDGFIDEVALKNDNFYSVDSKVYSVAQIPLCDGYRAVYTKYTRGKLIDCGEKTLDSSSVSYKIEPELDDVYCLQPGKTGPGKECRRYVENRSFDVTKCKTQFLTDKESRVECGLAQILFETVKKNDDGDYVSNKKYNNGAITLALRLWMAKYAGGSQLGLGNLNNGQISDDPEIDWVTKDNFYAATVKAINEVKNYSSREAVIKEYDEIVKKAKHKKAIKCNVDKKKGITKASCAIYDAIILFKKAENVSAEDYLGGTEFLRETPQITINPVPTTEQYTSVYRISLPEEIQRLVVEKDCEDINNKACIVYPKVYDASGKEIDSSLIDIEGYCKKEYCQIKLTYKMICEEIKYKQEIGKDYLRIYIRNWYERSGWIRFYQSDVNPQKYQQMITFAFNKKYCEDKLLEKGTETYYDYTISIECPCGEDKCNDLTKTKKLKTNCNNDETTTVNVDPDMNCIINACKPSDKLQYDETDKLGANVNICHIYCREDSDFYLAPKTTVYTGMRFSYDIRPSLLEAGKVSSSFKPEQKITSIVLQKKQCTSEIDYNSWKKTYDETINLIKNERNSTVKKVYVQKLDDWINSLKTCNLYNGTNVKNNIVSNLNSNLKLELSYSDSKYGNVREMGKVFSNEISETKYCTNTKSQPCYKYEENKEVTLTGKNNTVSIQYCNTKNCSNITVPRNDYAAFVVTSEIDFYQPLRYYAEEYTGTAVLESEREKDKTYLKLPDYEYPIKIDTKEGEYNINYKFSGVGKLSKYEYSCKYVVSPSTPTGDDCCVTYKDGSIDCSKCNSKIIYRNVDLSNLFPTEREYQTNWTNKEEVIKEIQDSASTIFTDEDKHLEYRYTLTPDAIKQIKEYNAEQNKFGGYLNETLSCGEGMSIFIDCESEFLNDISRGSGKLNKIKIGKAGGR